MGIEGFSDILVSKVVRKYLPGQTQAGHFLWEFPPSIQLCEYLLPKSKERGVLLLVYVLLLLHFAPFSTIVFVCFQLPSNVIVHSFVRRGSILSPRFEKARSQPFDHFLIQPRPSLHWFLHCTCGTLPLSGKDAGIRDVQPTWFLDRLFAWGLPASIELSIVVAFALASLLCLSIRHGGVCSIGILQPPPAGFCTME